jgi:DNA-binding protein HU-beta
MPPRQPSDDSRRILPNFLYRRGRTLIKQDIVHHVIERTGLPRAKAEAAVDTVFEGLKQALAAGDRIELRGFGVFSVRPRKTGIGRNPRTGTEVSIAPGKAVRFKPGKELHALDTGSGAGSAAAK